MSLSLRFNMQFFLGFLMGVAVVLALYYDYHFYVTKKFRAHQPNRAIASEIECKPKIITQKSKPIVKYVEVERECASCPQVEAQTTTCNGFSTEVLPPPNFDPATPLELATTPDGMVTFKYTPVKGAKRYHVIVQTPKGKNVKTYRIYGTKVSLKDVPLPIDQYEQDYVVKLASVNGLDQEGPRSAPRPLHVKTAARILAPKIQKIEVEE